MPQPVAPSAAVQDCGLNADRDTCQTQSGVRPRDSAALAPGAEQQRAAGGNHDDSSDAPTRSQLQTEKRTLPNPYSFMKPGEQRPVTPPPLYAPVPPGDAGMVQQQAQQQLTP